MTDTEAESDIGENDDDESFFSAGVLASVDPAKNQYRDKVHNFAVLWKSGSTDKPIVYGVYEGTSMRKLNDADKNLIIKKLSYYNIDETLKPEHTKVKKPSVKKTTPPPKPAPVVTESEAETDDGDHDNDDTVQFSEEPKHNPAASFKFPVYGDEDNYETANEEADGDDDDDDDEKTTQAPPPPAPSKSKVNVEKPAAPPSKLPPVVKRPTKK